MPRDARQRLEMVCAGRFRREQQENKIDRLVVERFEIDRLVEPRKQPEQPAELRKLAMRDSDTIADGC